VTKAAAVVAGKWERWKVRIIVNINKMLVNQVLPTCQLQMGMNRTGSGKCVEYDDLHMSSSRTYGGFISYFEYRKSMLCATLWVVG